MAIGRALAERFDRIVASPVPAAEASALIQGFTASGWAGGRSVQTVNWRIDVSHGDFAAYWRDRPAALRSTVRRRSALTRVNMALYSVFDADTWATYEDIYARSWKPVEGSGFLRALAEQEGAAGTLRLGILGDGAMPLAAQLWLVENGVATIHKLAHVEDARGLLGGQVLTLGVVTLLSAAMFEAVIARDKPALIDFGTGDDRYKADWMDSRSDLYRVELVRRGSAAHMLWRLRRLVRRSESD